MNYFSSMTAAFLFTLSMSILSLSVVAVVGCGGGGDAGGDAGGVEVPAAPRPDSGSGSGNAATGKPEAETSAANNSTPVANLIPVPDSIVKYIFKPIEGVTFATDQQKRADDLIMSRGGEFKELRGRRQKVLTEDLRKKRTAAIKQAKSSGGDVDAAEEAAVGPAVYAELKQIDEDQTRLINELRKSVKGILTPAQRKLLNDSRAAAKKG